MTKYGLDTLGSLEIIHDDTLGWTMQAYSAAGRVGEQGQSRAVVLDAELASAVLVSAPTVLSADGYQVLGTWHIDEEARTVWANVGLAGPDGAVQPPAEEFDKIYDAEARWARTGHGRETGRP